MVPEFKWSMYTSAMLNAAKRAGTNKERGNNSAVLSALKRALHFAEKAKGVKDTGQDFPKDVVDDFITETRGLYQRELLSQIPEGEREVVLSVLQFWANMGIVAVGASPLEQLEGVFEIAKQRLGGGKEALAIIYDGDHAPEPLRNIIQPFLEGEATQEETEARLDEATTVLAKWLPALLMQNSDQGNQESLAGYEMFRCAWAYCTNPEARQVSEFKYPSGSPMSVRAAKRKGLM